MRCIIVKPEHLILSDADKISIIILMANTPINTSVLNSRRYLTFLHCQGAEVYLHWNKTLFILTKLSSLAVQEVVKMTTSSAAGDENFIRMTTFSFQCRYQQFLGERLSLSPIIWLSDSNILPSFSQIPCDGMWLSMDGICFHLGGSSGLHCLIWDVHGDSTHGGCPCYAL